VSFQGLSGKARSFRSVSNEPETCVHGRRPVTLRTSCELARIRQEERMMLERFGADYRDYMASTKRLVPWSL